MDLRLYRNAAGEHVPAWRLTPAEAVAVRDQLEVRDLPYLQDAALAAVQATSGLSFGIPEAARPVASDLAVVLRLVAPTRLVMAGRVLPLRKAA